MSLYRVSETGSGAERVRMILDHFLTKTDAFADFYAKTLFL